jgi:carboxyl-terminal processing protease
MTDMSGKFGGIGVMVEYNDLDESIMVSTVYPDSPAEKAGIKVGDYIHAVDGKTVEELGYLNAVNYVRGEIGTSVEITVLRGEELVTVTAIRGEVEELNVVYEIDDEKQIGYVQIVSFKENTFPQFKEAIDSLESAGVKGIIFDLRNNPGGYVDSVLSVISYLIPNDVPVMSYQYKGRDKIELKSKDQGEDHVVNLPFVVICNQYTASAGEIFTAAIRDYRNDKMLEAKIVGVNTYGKGIMQSSYYYPMDKSTVTFTVAYYNPPCKINYHGTGVTPDVIVEIENNTDTQYEAAVKELQNLISDN